MERLTDVNIVYYEVAKIMLIDKISLPPPCKGFVLKLEHYGNSNLTSYIVWYPKKSIPTTRMVTGDSEGEGGPKSNIFNKQDWKFQGGGSEP